MRRHNARMALQRPSKPDDYLEFLGQEHTDYAENRSRNPSAETIPTSPR